MSKFTTIIRSIRDEASGVKTFVLDKPEGFTFSPGQYCWISLPGYKSAPMAIASGLSNETLDFTIRAWGDMTKALFEQSPGDEVEVDGPYGTSFPITRITEGNNLHLIGGGTGITPIRSLIKSTNGTGKKIVYYGAKSPQELLYYDELTTWDATIKLTVDKGDTAWSGSIGLVTTLLEPVEFDPEDLFFVCGPKPMEAAIVNYLRDEQVNESNIYVSLEKFDAQGNVVGPVLPATASEVEF